MQLFRVILTLSFSFVVGFFLYFLPGKERQKEHILMLFYYFSQICYGEIYEPTNEVSKVVYSIILDRDL